MITEMGKIIQVVPKWNHMNPYKREAEGDFTEKESTVRTEARCYSVDLETPGRGDNQGVQGTQL